ncbi:MAG: hypothetical protein PHI50_02695 [Alphaproteobacteria bacterium]|nr:hypothetical protein [Alphaproteobacteria bacterium]
MLLKVFSPTGIILEKEIEKLSFQAVDGGHTFLEHHADYISELTPDVLTYFIKGKEKPLYIACNKGVLVKQNEVVFLSVRWALLGNDLKKLMNIMTETFQKEEQERREFNTVMARLEAGLTRGFISLKQKETLYGKE